jgi:hypothetical protein
MGITETNIRKLLSVFGVNQVPPQTLKGVKGILDTALPPVPISASFLLYTINSAQSNTANSSPVIYQPNNPNLYPVVPGNYGAVLKPEDFVVPVSADEGDSQAVVFVNGTTQSLVARLDYSATLISKFIGTSQSFFVLITINRGTYWGDCNLSMIAPPQFSLIEENPIPPSISQNETQTAIAFEFTPDAAGKYTAVFQLDCGGVLISRTLEVTVEDESNYGNYGDDGYGYGYGYGFSGLGDKLLK